MLKFACLGATLSLSLLAPGAQAATSGEVGASSTGTIGVSLTVAETVRVTSQRDFGFSKPAAHGNVAAPLCVFARQGTQFSVETTAQLGAGTLHSARFERQRPRAASETSDLCADGETLAHLKVAMGSNSPVTGALTLLITPE